MPVEWRNLDLPLLGLDKRSAPPHARGSLELINYELDRTGGLRQRRGMATRGTMTNGIGLLALHRGQPFAIDGTTLDAVLWDGAAWSPSVGQPCPVAVRRHETLASFERVRSPSVIRPASTEYVVSWCQDTWQTPTRYAVLDATLEERLYAGEIPKSGATHVGPPRWAADGRGVAVVGNRAGGVTDLPLHGLIYTPATRAIAATALGVNTRVDAGTGATTIVSYDCDGIPGESWVAVACVDAALNVKLRTYTTSTWTLKSESTPGAADVASTLVSVATWKSGSTYRVALLWSNGKAGALNLFLYSCDAAGSLVFLTNTTDVLDQGGGIIDQLTVEVLSATATYCAATGSGLGTERRRTMYRRADGASTQQAREQLSISQRAIVRSATELWQPLVHHYTAAATGLSTADSVWALVPLGDATSVSASVPLYALALRGLAYGPEPRGSVGRVAGGSVVAQAIRQKLTAYTGSAVAGYGAYEQAGQTASIGLLSLDWDWKSWMITTSIGPYLLTSGGQVGLYDGARLAEAGWAWRPEYPQIGGGGAAPGESRVFSSTYAWWDATGALHLSEPSPTRTVPDLTPTIPAPFTVSHYNLTLTRRHLDYRQITSIEWRTTNAGLVYHRATDGGAPANPWPAIAPDSTLSLLTPAANDSVADSVLGERPQLYTDSGELAHIAPPSARHVHVHGRRVWLADCEVETEVWHSQVVEAGDNAEDYRRAPCWSPLLALSTDSPARATATLADKLLILCDRDVYVVVGDGPGRDGSGGFQVQKLLTGVGVAVPQSVVSAQDGVYFVSERGLYRIGLDLALSPVGAPIQPYLDTSNALRWPVVLAERHQIIWSRTAYKDLFVWDYLLGQWARWQLASGDAVHRIAAAADTDLWLAVDAAGALGYASQLREATDGAVSDAGVVPQAVVQIPWLHLGGIVGWFRTRRVGVRANGIAQGAMAFDFRRDYDDVAGSVVNYSVPIGATHAIVRAPVQKAEAMSVRISTTQAAGTPHEVWGLTMELGMLPGTAKRATAERR